MICPREFNSVGKRTMHNICKVRGSNPGHHQKNAVNDFNITFTTF